jgi:site-specific recombinase XerD
MRLYQRNGIWHVAFPGNRRKSLKTRDKQTAERLFARAKREALRGNLVALERGKSVTLGQFAEEYRRHCEAHKRAHKRDTYSVNKLIEWIGASIPMTAITPKRLDDFHAELIRSGLKRSGVAITYRHLRAAFSQAVKWDLIKANPYDRCQRIKVDPEPPRFYSEAELKTIFSEIANDNDFHDAITVYLYTGLRRSELWHLTARDVDTKNGLLTVRMSKTRSRVVPLEPLALEVLARRAKRTPVGRLWSCWNHPDRITHRWGRLMKRLGMAGRLHDLRHSFASYLVMSGADLRSVQELLGHSDLTVTAMYSHLAPEHLRRTVAKLGNLHKISTAQKLEVVNG